MSEVLNLGFEGGSKDVAASFGANGYIYCSDSDDFAIGTNWTIDGWVKFNSVTGQQTFVTQYQGVGVQWWFGMDSSNDIGVWVDGMDADASFFGDQAFVANRWYHVAWCKVGSDNGVYIDGQQVGYQSTACTGNIGGSLQVGAQSTTLYMNGFMKSMRISDTNRFGASPDAGDSDTITVPTSFPSSDSDTMLLLKMDEAAGSTSYTDSSPSAHSMTTDPTVVQKSTLNALDEGAWLVDSSASAHTVTAVGDAKQVVTAINNKRQAYFFDGDSDYITIPDSADWDISTNWTVDFWVKPTSVSGTTVPIGQYVDATHVWNCYQINGVLGAQIYNGGPEVTLNGGTLSTGIWQHVAIVRNEDAGSYYWGIYLDGIQTAYVADDSIATFAGVLQIGAAGAGYYFNGHMKNIRIEHTNTFSASPNVGLTDTITVPTADPVAGANTKLLLTAQTPSLNSPLCSTAYCGGDTHYFTVPDSSDWDIGTGNYTLEGWFWTSDNRNEGLIDVGNMVGHADGFGMYLGADYNLYWVNNSNTLVAVTGATAINKWMHIAVVRAGTGTNECTIYIDGVAKATGTSAVDLSGSTAGVAIGNRFDSLASEGWLGYIKGVRISNNARYTADFTPSTTPFADDANTLLLVPFDGVPDDTDDTNGWLTDSTGTHTVSAVNSPVCKYIEDYRNRTVRDDSGQDHTGVMVGTAKNDWITVEGNGCLGLDGSSYLTMADSDDWDFGTNASFTTETWVKYDDIAAHCLYGNGTSTGWGIYYTGADYQFWMDGAARETATFTPRLKEWYHIVGVRNSSTIKFYVNGSPLDAGTSYGTAVTDSQEFWVGSNVNGSAQTVNGHMDMVQVDNGTALYTAPFIPPVYPTSGASGNAFQVIMF